MVEPMPMIPRADPRAPAPTPLGWFPPAALAGLLLAAVSPIPASLAAASPAATQEPDPARIATAVDSIVADALADGRAAGMSVAVVHGGDTIVLKGYGYAELEFEVPTPDRAIYEIGSVTKQFTAAAVLLLQEEGKLSLDDDLTDHLPDYPTEGHHIPLRRLLDHTSGIKGYTEIPEFRELSIRKLPRDSLVALFSSRPFDFAPGEAMIYNNSAYCAVAPAAVTRGIAEAIFGPWSPEAVPLDAGPEAYAGEYRGPGRGAELVLTVKPDLLGTGLNLRRGDRPALGLTHLGGEVFARDRQRLTFLRERDRVVAVRVEFPGMTTVLRRQP